MKRTPWFPHLLIIIAIMACGALVYYADQISILNTIVAEAPIKLARFSTHRILSIVPVAYASFIFGLRGGVITTIVISLALLPRALFISSQEETAAVEIIAFFVVAMLISWLIAQLRRTASRLGYVQQNLASSLQTIRGQQEKLTSMYKISTAVYQTLDTGEIAKQSLREVLGLSLAQAGWVYLKDGDAGDLILSAHSGLSPSQIADASQIKLGEYLDGQVAQTGQPAVVGKDTGKLQFDLSDIKSITAVFVVPLRTRMGTIGTIGVILGEQQYRVEEKGEKLELLSTLSSGIGLAIEHARLYEQERISHEQLRLSEERYRGLFENASEAIFVCSAAGRVISANRACEHLTGYSMTELANVPVYQYFSKEESHRIESLFSNLPAVDSNEFCLVRKDGTKILVKLKFSTLLKNDRLVGFQIIALDITEEKNLRQNMQYYVSQITRAVEEERLRISRELHDDTAQVLASLSRDIDSLVARERNKLSKPVVERLEKLCNAANNALQGVRRFSQDLRPSILDDLGLVPALEWLVTDLGKYGIATETSVSGSQRRLASERELAIFRIVQEALSNVRKHSKANELKTTIDFDASAITIIIRDNGQGFTMPPRTSDLAMLGKLGIIGMRERTRLIGGTLVVLSTIGSGTTITARIPYES